MTNTGTAPQSCDAFLFKLEVTVSAPRYEVALDQLIRALKDSEIFDYRILSGESVEPGTTGRLPSEARADTSRHEPAKPAAPMPKSPSGSRTKFSEKTKILEDLMERLSGFIHSGKLVRLHINKGRGVKMNFPGRILSLDPETRNMTVYHVDEKKVYNVALNEVDDIIE
jgi:hypothetical protein